MRSRRPSNDEVAEVARRRLELLSAELAVLQRDRRPVPAATEGPAADPPAAAQPAVAQHAAPQPAAAQHAASQHAAAQHAADKLDLPASDASIPPNPSGRHAVRAGGVVDSAGGWIRDRLPPTLQGAVALSRGQLGVLAVILLAGLVTGAWWTLRTDGRTTVVPAAPGIARRAPSTTALVSLAASQAAAAGGAPSSQPSPSPEVTTLVVDVAGKVRRPGIATLPAGSRVVDALQAAGGPRRGVNLTALNLARPLVDGEQILVGVPAASGAAASAASVPTAATTTGGLVNLNTATQAELETLPGVGPVTAQAILQWRTDNGAFTAVDQLLEVSGIGEVTLAEIAPYVTI